MSESSLFPDPTAHNLPSDGDVYSTTLIIRIASQGNHRNQGMRLLNRRDRRTFSNKFLRILIYNYMY
jgi:hypothetical protein